MSVTGDVYQFTGNELLPVEHAIPGSLSVADSWLVQDGSVRALDRHLARFAGSVNQVSNQELLNFFDAVIAATPLQGSWFPRIEFRHFQPIGQQLFFRIRPAPIRSAECTLWTLNEKDPRTSPETKGPDLSVCQKIRRQANLHGADEAVILNHEGLVSDGALSSIVWWEEDRLCAPDDTLPWLPSITRALVFELASQAGFETGEVRRKPSDLEGLEVWSLSALQGIRLVSSWSDVKVAGPKRLRSFKKRLDLLSGPIGDTDFSIA